MDIGLVQPELIYHRGAEKQVCKLAYFLNKQGHDVSFYTLEKNQEYVFDPLLKGVEIVSLDQTWYKELKLGMDYVRWYYLMKKLSYEIATHDIINAHNHPAQWVSNFTNLPTVWTCNEPYYYNISSIMRKIFYPHIYLDKKISSNLKLILSLDSRMEELIRNRYSTSVETIGSGVDLFRKIKHIENDFMDIIFVGPIDPQKRPLDILKAFNLLENENIHPKLHFVGDILSSGLQKQMLDLARSLPLEIIFYGSVSDDKLYQLYDMADISIFVPETQPWGIFPLETILGGIPTIISDQCGIRDIISDDNLVIQTGNVEQLATKILEIKEDRDYYVRKNMKLSTILSEKYSWENYAKRMVDVFRKVLN